MDTITRRPRGRPRQENCAQGHPLSGDNLYIAPTGERRCRACQYDRHAAWRAANRIRWNEIVRGTRDRKREAANNSA